MDLNLPNETAEGEVDLAAAFCPSTLVALLAKCCYLRGMSLCLVHHRLDCNHGMIYSCRGSVMLDDPAVVQYFLEKPTLQLMVAGLPSSKNQLDSVHFIENTPNNASDLFGGFQTTSDFMGASDACTIHKLSVHVLYDAGELDA